MKCPVLGSQRVPFGGHLKVTGRPIRDCLWVQQPASCILMKNQELEYYEVKGPRIYSLGESRWPPFVLRTVKKICVFYLKGPKELLEAFPPSLAVTGLFYHLQLLPQFSFFSVTCLAWGRQEGSWMLEVAAAAGRKQRVPSQDWALGRPLYGEAKHQEIGCTQLHCWGKGGREWEWGGGSTYSLEHILSHFQATGVSLSYYI